MKKLFFLFLTALLPWTFFASEEGAGQEKLTAETGKLSIRLLFNEWAKDLPEEQLKYLEETLYQAMQKDPGVNLSLAAARQNSVRCFDAELSRLCDEKLEALFRAAGETWTAEQKIVSDAERKRFLQNAQSKYFAKCFQAARDRLVREQKKQVFQNVYPSEEELEKFDDKQLVGVLEKRFQAGITVPLWEENAALLRKEILEPAIRSGRKQQKLQLESARSLQVPQELWDASAIIGFLEKAVQDSTVQKLEADEKRYSLFGATRQAIERRAQWIPAERLIAAVPKTLPPEQYRELLEKHPAAHRSREASRRQSRAVFVPYMVREGIQKSGIPAELAQKLEQDAEFQKRMTEEFEKRFAAFDQLRKEFAQKQLREFWKELAVGKWRPELTETERFAASADKEIPELKSKPEESEELLDETRSLMQDKLRATFEDEAKRLEAQTQCVLNIYQEIFSQMLEKQNAKKKELNTFLSHFFSEKNITLQTVIEAYRKMVLRQCSRPLFPSVEESIEARSRAILMTVTQAEPEPDAEQQDEPPKVEKIITIELSGKRNRLFVDIGDWHGNYPVNAVRTAEIADELKRLMAAPSEQVQYKIEIVVHGATLYYHTVAEVQRDLAEKLNCTIDDALEL